jgi:hypothetical protein
VNSRSWTLLIALLTIAVASPVSQASAAKLKGPKRVTPGKTVTFKASGYAANARINVTLQPTVNRDGNGFGVRIKKAFRASAKGRATLRFRWPRRYDACAGGAGPCRKLKWKGGSRADANACGDIRNRNFACARRVVRIRKASASAAARCGRVTITPMSGDVLTKIKTRGIGCKAARRKLSQWGKAGYRPRPGPRGYRCRTIIKYKVGNTRDRCRRKGRRLPVISFDTGF